VSKEPTTNRWDLKIWELGEQKPQHAIAQKTSTIAAQPLENRPNHFSGVHAHNARPCQRTMTEVHVRKGALLPHSTEEVQVVTYNTLDNAFSLTQISVAITVAPSTLDLPNGPYSKLLGLSPCGHASSSSSATASRHPHNYLLAHTLKVRRTTWALIRHQRNPPCKHVGHIASQTSRLCVSTTEHPEGASGVTTGTHRSPLTPAVQYSRELQIRVAHGREHQLLLSTHWHRARCRFRADAPIAAHNFQKQYVRERGKPALRPMRSHRHAATGTRTHQAGIWDDGA
jgi:hypothetical protein